MRSKNVCSQSGWCYSGGDDAGAAGKLRIWNHEYVPGDLQNASAMWEKHGKILRGCPGLEMVSILGKYGTFREKLLECAELRQKQPL